MTTERIILLALVVETTSGNADKFSCLIQSIVRPRVTFKTLAWNQKEETHLLILNLLILMEVRPPC